MLRIRDGVDTLTERLLASRSRAAEETLRDCLPYLLSYLQRDHSWPNPAFRRLYRAILEILYVSTSGSRADLLVYGDLLQCLLGLGISEPTEYRELVATVAELWARFVAPSNFDWGIDMLELLVVQPCADLDVRIGFLDAVLQGCQKYPRHLRPEQRALLEVLAADLGARERVSEYLPSQEAVASAEQDPLQELSQLSVAFYSLTETALRQVKRILEDRYPGVRVSLSSDFVGTTRLKQLAKQADLFVVATASAKHAATEFIDANRPKSLPTLRAAGRGAASLLAAVRSHFLAANG